MTTLAHTDPIREIAAARATAAACDTTIYANDQDEHRTSMRRLRFEGERKAAAHPVAWPVRAYAVVAIICALSILASGALLYRQVSLVDHRLAAEARV